MPLKIKGWDNIPSFCTCLVGFMSVAMDMFYLSGIFRWVMSSCPTGDDEREASRVREWKTRQTVGSEYVIVFTLDYKRVS